MSHIPHTRRTAGRYVFQRRVHYRNLISKPLPLALGTADPKVARIRAAILSARFVLVKADVDAMLEDGRALTGHEIEALFRAELERELIFYVQSAYENASWSTSVQDVAAQETEAYRIMRRPGRELGLTYEDRIELTNRELSRDIGPIEDYARQILDMLDDDTVIRKLKDIGAPAHRGNISAARTHLIRAAASAAARVRRVFDDDVMDAADPVAALSADLGPISDAVRALTAGPTPAEAAKTPAANGLFVLYDARPFSAVIDDVLAELKADNVWKGNLKQQRRIMETFAWVTGDKPLGAYSHLDAAAYKKGMQQLPARFYYGSRSGGAMSRPFAEVIAELPPTALADRRSPKTVNRDLSTMATVAKHLTATSWKPQMHGATVMNFSAGPSRSRAIPMSTPGRYGLLRTSPACSNRPYMSAAVVG